jgi:branched-chain amino acid transport system permease protein
MRPLIPGVMDVFGTRLQYNKILIAIVSWSVIGLIWLLVNRTKAGKTLLAASINPRGLTILGFELGRIYWMVWTIYGVLSGIAGVLMASFLGVSTANAGQLTASAFSIVVLGGLGSVSGSLIASLVVGYLETATTYLINPTLRPIPALLLLVIVVYVRPQGLLGRR